MFDHYSLPTMILEDLGAGEVDTATARLFFSAQVSIDYLLTLHVLRSVPSCERIRSAIDVLSEAQKQAPENTAQACHESWAGVWVSRCLAAFDESKPADSTAGEVLSRIGAVAAVAAWHAGVEAETWTVCENNTVLLPTLGIARLSVPDRRFARIKVRGELITIRCGPEEVSVWPHDATAAANWVPMRRLTAKHRDRELVLTFDDLDPLRDCFGATPEGRVPPDRFQQWRDLFEAAWLLLCRYAPKNADQVVHGMRVLVPLADTQQRVEVSVSSQDAVGALAMTLPADPAGFAIALVHEQAHSTLNGLLSMVKLFNQDRGGRYFAPWRPDPRPLAGLFHGTFAFLAVAEAWHALCADKGLRPLALEEFTLRRAQVDRALDTLATVPALTSQGRQVVTGMRRRCDTMLTAAAPPGAVARANELVEAQHAVWRQRYSKR